MCKKLLYPNVPVLTKIENSSPVEVDIAASSVGGEAIALPLACRPKCRIRKILRFLALLRLFYALEWTKYWFETPFELYIQEGAN